MDISVSSKNVINMALIEFTLITLEKILNRPKSYCKKRVLAPRAHQFDLPIFFT